jgi:hypothetical protein
MNRPAIVRKLASSPQPSPPEEEREQAAPLVPIAEQ